MASLRHPCNDIKGLSKAFIVVILKAVSTASMSFFHNSCISYIFKTVNRWEESQVENIEIWSFGWLVKIKNWRALLQICGMNGSDAIPWNVMLSCWIIIYFSWRHGTNSLATGGILLIIIPLYLFFLALTGWFYVVLAALLLLLGWTVTSSIKVQHPNLLSKYIFLFASYCDLSTAARYNTFLMRCFFAHGSTRFLFVIMDVVFFSFFKNINPLFINKNKITLVVENSVTKKHCHSRTQCSRRSVLLMRIQ